MVVGALDYRNEYIKSKTAQSIGKNLKHIPLGNVRVGLPVVIALSGGKSAGTY